jgi:hypothetical protein
MKRKVKVEGRRSGEKGQEGIGKIVPAPPTEMFSSLAHPAIVYAQNF